MNMGLSWGLLELIPAYCLREGADVDIRGENRLYPTSLYDFRQISHRSITTFTHILARVALMLQSLARAVHAIPNWRVWRFWNPINNDRYFKQRSSAAPELKVSFQCSLCVP